VVMHFVAGGGALLGVLAAVCTAAVVGGIVALPALRLRGLYLALATLAFAVAMDNTFFVSGSIMGTGNSISIGRPSVFGLGLSSDRAFVIALGVVLAVCLVGVGGVRRSAFGRRLVALNDSPAASATLGINPIAPRFAVFMLSGGLAGLAGALYGGLSGTVAAGQFAFLQSAALFVVLTLSGVSLLSGAVLAGIGLAIAPVIGSHLPALSDFTYLGFGLGIIGIGRNPNAIGQLYARLGDRWPARARLSLAPDGAVPGGTPGDGTAPHGTVPGGTHDGEAIRT
jgi:branched-chain amino acid transport system permease protein